MLLLCAATAYFFGSNVMNCCGCPRVKSCKRKDCSFGKCGNRKTVETEKILFVLRNLGPKNKSILITRAEFGCFVVGGVLRGI